MTLTVKEYAARELVHPKTVLRWIRQRKLDARRTLGGREIRITLPDVPSCGDVRSSTDEPLSAHS